MNAISIQVELSSLNLLIPLGNNNYNIAFQFFKDDNTNSPLDQAGVPNQYITTVNTLSPIFTVNMPVVDQEYNFSGKVKIMTNNIDSVCNATKSFTINSNPSIAAGRSIWMNATGYGLAPEEATGIHPDWIPRLNGFLNMSYNGNTFSGINGFRMCIKWRDYEPTEGVYNDTALRNAINWCIARGLKFAVCFWALREDGDNFLSTADKATGSNGQIWKVENNKHTISLYSTTGKAKLKATVKHLAQVMTEFPNDTTTISLGYGDTEEFFMPIIRNVALTGYSSNDITAWNAYATANGQSGASAPVTPNAADAYATGNYWNSTAVTRLWYEFITDGLAGIHAAFRDGVHEGGRKVCGFFADAGGAQSAWYGHYRINKIFAGSDNVYSSEGGNIYELPSKLMATDLIRGTFPNADPAIEFDPQDIAANPADGNAYGINVNPSLFLQYSKAFFERGGKHVHLATAFSIGENGNVNNIAQLAPALWELQQTVIPSSSVLTPPTQGTAINYVLTSFSGDAGYRGQWSSQAGGLNKQIKITLS